MTSSAPGPDGTTRVAVVVALRGNRIEGIRRFRDEVLAGRF